MFHRYNRAFGTDIIKKDDGTRRNKSYKHSHMLNIFTSMFCASISSLQHWSWSGVTFFDVDSQVWYLPNLIVLGKQLGHFQSISHYSYLRSGSGNGITGDYWDEDNWRHTCQLVVFCQSAICHPLVQTFVIKAPSLISLAHQEPGWCWVNSLSIMSCMFNKRNRTFVKFIESIDFGR